MNIILQKCRSKRFPLGEEGREIEYSSHLLQSPSPLRQGGFGSVLIINFRLELNSPAPHSGIWETKKDM